MTFQPLHQYIINEKIAEGSNSVVYICFSLITRNDVTVKKIQLDKDEGVPSTVVPEILIMRELKHPNIVLLTNTYMNDNILYLVFEFLPINLKQHMDSLQDDKLLEPQLVKSYLHQITQGIFFCFSLALFSYSLYLVLQKIPYSLAEYSSFYKY